MKKAQIAAIQAEIIKEREHQKDLVSRYSRSGGAYLLTMINNSDERLLELTKILVGN